MKLTKDWYAAAARKISENLKNVKNAIEVEAKNNQKDAFWATEEGKVIKDLEETYNSPCKTKVFTFNLESYLPYIPVYNIPGPTSIIDRLILSGNGENEAVMHVVFEYYIEKMKVYYAKYPAYAITNFEAFFEELGLD